MQRIIQRSSCHRWRNVMPRSKRREARSTGAERAVITAASLTSQSSDNSAGDAFTCESQPKHGWDSQVTCLVRAHRLRASVETQKRVKYGSCCFSRCVTYQHYTSIPICDPVCSRWQINRKRRYSPNEWGLAELLGLEPDSLESRCLVQNVRWLADLNTTKH